MKFVYAVFMSVVLIGCASTNGYERASGAGDYGYTDTKLEDDRYRIEYRLRGKNIGKAQDYALLRAAELTMAAGKDWFNVVDRDSDVDEGDGRRMTEIRTERRITRDCGLLGCRTTSSPTYGVDSTIGRIDRDATVVVVEIVLGDGEKSDNANAYDAAQLADNIRSRM